MATDTVHHALARLSDIDIRLQGHAVLHRGVPVAVLNPATLFGFDGQILNSIWGPLGVVSDVADDAESLWGSILATGSVLFGSPDEVRRAVDLLNADRTSRTASYICCVVRDLAGLVSAFDRFAQSRVLLLGCGGVGSQVAVLLAGAGVGHITLVDPDVIDPSNLNRQILYTLDDVGSRKVDVLAREIGKRFPDVSVEAIPTRLSAETLGSLLTKVSATLLTADDPIGLAAAARPIAAERGIILVTAGYVLGNAIVRLWGTDSTLSPLSELQWVRGPVSIMPSCGPTNAELAGVASAVLLHALGGLCDPSRSIRVAWPAHRFTTAALGTSEASGSDSAPEPVTSSPRRLPPVGTEPPPSQVRLTRPEASACADGPMVPAFRGS